MMNGVCRYCGQMQNVEAETQEDADNKATEMCDCPQAIKDRSLDSFCEKVATIVFDTAEETGFEPLSNEQYKLICVLADKIFQKEINGVTVKLDDRTLKLSKDKDGYVKFRQTKTLEVGTDG